MTQNAERADSGETQRGAPSAAHGPRLSFVGPGACAVPLRGERPARCLWSIGVSFFHFRADRLNTPPHFLGFANYLDLISDEDIWEHFINTLVMIASSVTVQLVVGALLALTCFIARFLADAW